MSNMGAFLIQRGSYRDASYDEMVKTYGSVDDYLSSGLGLSSQEVDRLGDELLE
jgi:protein tyrosine/serine phosphatase